MIKSLILNYLLPLPTECNPGAKTWTPILLFLWLFSVSPEVHTEHLPYLKHYAIPRGTALGTLTVGAKGDI